VKRIWGDGEFNFFFGKISQKNPISKHGIRIFFQKFSDLLNFKGKKILRKFCPIST
jgi:hypothetical protein